MAAEYPAGYTPTPLASLPPLGFMSQTAWDTFFAMVDASLPSVTSTSRAKDAANQVVLPDVEFNNIVKKARENLMDPPSEEDLIAFLEYRPVEDEAFLNDIRGVLGNAPQKKQIGAALDFLNTRAGSLLLTGHWTPIPHQPLHVREAILKKWWTSSIVSLRVMAKSICVMAQKASCLTNPYFGKVTGYTDIPKGWSVQQGYEYKFLQPGPGNDVYEINTDVIIVGSGCGGGVSAKNLAEAGHKVLVVEKGYHFSPDRLPMTQSAASSWLYDNAGLIMTENTSTNVLSGSVWGGGGTVNWSVCLRLQSFVREEWAARGLPLFTSSEFDECIDRVWDAIGAGSDAIRQNHNNHVVLEGSKKLGWRSDVVAQNTGHKEHYCGRCHLGCGLNEKRGPAVAWLPAAAEAGAEFMEGFEAKKILFAADGVTATGVEGVWTARDPDGSVHSSAEPPKQRRVVIKAKKVVVSAGSIQTPALLLRSKIKNSQIGRNLYLHPANMLAGVFDHDEHGWEGGIITACCGEFENLDSKGHGFKIETLCMVPYVALSTQNWDSGIDARLLTPKYRHLRAFIAIVRDRDTGKIFIDDKTGHPRVDYTASAFDADHSLDGIEAIAKLCYVMGAKELRPFLPGTKPFIFAEHGDPKLQANHEDGKDPEFTDPAFAAWLKTLRKVGNRSPAVPWASAHQMGSCRMSSKASEGVVDSKGKVWGCNNLYIADASVFPSASGVNPMVTVMAVADWISRGLVKELSISK